MPECSDDDGIFFQPGTGSRVGNPLTHLIRGSPVAAAWQRSCHLSWQARLGSRINKVNPVRNSLGVILLGACLALPLNAFGQLKKDDQWENLKQVTRRRTYMYMDRALHC